MRATWFLLLAVATVRAVDIPSCDAEVDANCVGEGQDLSSEGINNCLSTLESRSKRCSDYLSLMENCKVDTMDGGVCGDAARDGEAIPCLVQRMKPEQLSEACQAALPEDDRKGLAKFWADGKRVLLIDEIADLNADDKDTYNRWKKRKGGSKSDKDKDRQYAIKTQKKAQVVKQVTTAVAERLAGGELTMDRATSLASREAKAAVEADMTGTLKAFTKGELAGIAKEAIKEAKATKTEL